MNRRDAISTLGAIGMGWFALNKQTASAAPSPDYPERTVRILVGTAPGGITDYMARLFAQYVAEETGQSFVVENRAGASGTLAASAVARSTADGYTLLATTPTVTVVAPHLYNNLNFVPSTDLQPVCLLGAGPMVLVVNADLPIKTVGELIAYAKARPGECAYASGGLGTAAHLTGELFASVAGLKLMHVPYKGDGQGVIDVVSGQVPMMFSVMSVLSPHIKSGRLRALAVASDARMKANSQIPTLKELGFQGMNSLAWVAIYVPSSTPPAIVETLNRLWQSAKTKTKVKENLASIGMDQVEFKTSLELTNFQKSENIRWGNVIQASGLKKAS